MKASILALKILFFAVYASAANAQCSDQELASKVQSYINSLEAPEGLCGSAEHASKYLKYAISLAEESCAGVQEIIPSIEEWKKSLAQAEATREKTCVY